MSELVILTLINAAVVLISRWLSHLEHRRTVEKLRSIEQTVVPLVDVTTRHVPRGYAATDPGPTRDAPNTPTTPTS
jgi:hypothetical protein